MSASSEPSTTPASPRSSAEYWRWKSSQSSLNRLKLISESEQALVRLNQLVKVVKLHPELASDPRLESELETHLARLQPLLELVRQLANAFKPKADTGPETHHRPVDQPDR